MGVSPGMDPLDRLQRNAVGLLAGLSLGSALWAGWGFGVSVALGGAMAWISFRWMKRAVELALGTGSSRRAGAVIAGFLGRFILILGGLFVMMRASFFSLFGAVLGLSVFVLAGFLEALLLLRKH